MTGVEESHTSRMPQQQSAPSLPSIRLIHSARFNTPMPTLRARTLSRSAARRSRRRSDREGSHIEE